jgi:hypothetical protein
MKIQDVYPGSGFFPFRIRIQDPETVFLYFKEPSLCSLAGRYDNSFPTQFLAPIDCSKIPAHGSKKHWITDPDPQHPPTLSLLMCRVITRWSWPA